MQTFTEYFKINDCTDQMLK